MNAFCRFLFRKVVTVNKSVALLVLCGVPLILYGIIFYRGTDRVDQLFLQNSVSNVQVYNDVVNTYYAKRKALTTSNLGSILFKNVEVETFIVESKKKREFTILIWKYWDWLQNRHLYSFRTARDDSPLDGCSVKNCVFMKSDRYLNEADAVVVHLQQGNLPKTNKRNPKQRWVFLSDESPINTFSLAKREVKMDEVVNIFNWSMTYRSGSDIPVPYGRTLPLSENMFLETTHKQTSDLIPNWNGKRYDVLVAILMSNCAVSYRMENVKELKKYIGVDLHGRCSENLKNSCPGHFKSDCPIMSQYLFYLVLENSMCQEYLTEKVFYNAYQKGAIPIIMGPTVEDCNRLLPPNSFLHVDNYADPKTLAEQITRLGNDIPKLLAFHEWRRHFKVVNDHGYFGSKSRHYCRICEALNYNDDAIKVYDEKGIRNFLDPSLLCRKTS